MGLREGAFNSFDYDDMLFAIVLAGIESWSMLMHYSL
jgi:hypothetical protein